MVVNSHPLYQLSYRGSGRAWFARDGIYQTGLRVASVSSGGWPVPKGATGRVGGKTWSGRQARRVVVRFAAILPVNLAAGRLMALRFLGEPLKVFFGPRGAFFLAPIPSMARSE